MLQSQPQPQQPQQPRFFDKDSVAVNDEVDLLQVLRSISQTWKPLLLSLIVVSAVWLALKAFQIVFIANETTYSKPIRLTFANAQKLTFPSGAKFAYSDIVAPAVVQQVFDTNNLSQYGLTVADLQGGLTSAPYAPTYPLIIRKYKIALSNKKLTIEEVADMQKKMELELEQVTTGEALISLRLYKKDIPKAVANKVLNDIPAIWADRTIKVKGVLNINAQIASATSLNAELLHQEDELVINDILNQKINVIKENIKKLTAYEGAQSVRDPVSGMKLIDLSAAVSDLQQYVIASLLAPVRLLVLSREPKLSSYYYEDQVHKLNIVLFSLKKQVEAVKYVNDSMSISEPSNNVQYTNKPNSQVVVPQVNADMLDKLASFSADLEREKYRQKLNDEWLDLTKEVADTEARINEAQRLINALQKPASQQETTNSRVQYLEKVQAGLPKIIEKMAYYFDVSERIYKQLSIESVGIKDQLYIPVSNSVLVSNVSFDAPTFFIIWAALMFLTAVIVVPACMVRNAMKAKAATE